jgi:uncharacterized protein YbjT (DUF2867 family)
VRIAIAGDAGLVGQALAAAAEDAGHEVVGVRADDALDLTGADAVIDVTDAPIGDPWCDGHDATPFFEEVARTLGAAAHAAGVPRTVVLSALGADRTPADGRGIHAYHAAKLAHERATREHAPHTRVLRSARVHDVAGRMLHRHGDGARAEIPDVLLQPVALDELVLALLDLAVSDDRPPVTELAGPRPERLPDLIARLDETVLVRPTPVSAALAAGALLPGPAAILAEGDFDEWLLRSVQLGERGLQLGA